MLLSVAVLPLWRPHWWDDNVNRLKVAAVLGGPVALWALLHAPPLLLHTLTEYCTFIALLGSMYAITGGLVLRGDLSGRPLSNTAVLLTGGVLASFIGTTGASMLLVRPLLRATEWRRHRALPIIFFIFMVSNVGGLLTPLGDPPLFLGYLRGVPFGWPLRLWRPWAVALSVLATVFFVLDSLNMRREDAAGGKGSRGDPSLPRPAPLRLAGVHNLGLLGGLLTLVVASGRFSWPQELQALSMVALGAIAWVTTPAALRRENDFTWGPMAEVATIFAGIFATMMPALVLLGERGARLGLSSPRQFFWVTGALSSFLDNTPTYVALSAAASSLHGTDPQALNTLIAHPAGAKLLAAISLGAVFMGANTYLGNGPNLMVQALAQARGIKMPSFVGYMRWSAAVLLPLFALIAMLFL